MSRAPKICSSPRCPNVQPCPDHTDEPWQRSRRAKSTLSGSKQQRRATGIKHRYDGICHVCGKPGADQVDHVIALSEGGADDESNLRPIHRWPCHWEKTAAEAARSRGGAATRPPFVILAGHPGTGKTAIRRRLAGMLGAASLGPDDFAGDWGAVYARLDQAESALVECVRLPRALRRKAKARGAVIVQLLASEDTRRRRLEQRGEPPEIVEAYLADDGAGIAYGEHVDVDIVVRTDDRPLDTIADDLEHRVSAYFD